jgi:hypothetical protein
MERKRKIVKTHYCFWDNPGVGLCGLKVRSTNVALVVKEVTCSHCLKKLKGKLRK